jgi:hypothetical protein
MLLTRYGLLRFAYRRRLADGDTVKTEPELPRCLSHSPLPVNSYPSHSIVFALPVAAPSTLQNGFTVKRFESRSRADGLCGRSRSECATILGHRACDLSLGAETVRWLGFES